MKRPLLVIDGDSLAHRAYHALPKSMRRAEGKPSNALVGFSNFLMRLWQAEAPRAEGGVGAAACEGLADSIANAIISAAGSQASQGAPIRGIAVVLPGRWRSIFIVNFLVFAEHYCVARMAIS